MSVGRESQMSVTIEMVRRQLPFGKKLASPTIMVYDENNIQALINGNVITADA